MKFKCMQCGDAPRIIATIDPRQILVLDPDAISVVKMVFVCHGDVDTRTVIYLPTTDTTETIIELFSDNYNHGDTDPDLPKG